MISHYTPLRERFDLQTAYCGDCIAWVGAHDQLGYGMIGAYGVRSVRAHRVAYELYVGPIPAGLEIDHLCRNRACVNPAHLEPVTRAENNRRRKTAARSHCRNGHEMTADNTYIWMRYPARKLCRACGRTNSNKWKGEA